MPRNARSSWGCVQKIAKDAYRLRWTEWHGREKVRRSRTVRGICKREADAEMHRLWEAHHLPPEERAAPCPTFCQCFDEWYLPLLERQLESGSTSKNTGTVYMSAWRSKVAPAWGDRVMCEVRPDDYQAWLDGFTASQAHVAHMVVMNLVKAARMHGVHGIEFANIRYRMPKGGGRKKPDGLEVYTLGELHAIIDAFAGSPIEAVVILMAKGSCRVGEAVAAAVGDMSFETYKGHLYAVYGLHRQYGQNSIGFIPLKTEFSARPVIVPEPWSLRLRAICAARTEEGEPFLCDSGAGAPLPRSTVASIWRKGFGAGGIDMRCLPMTKLRNSWATAALWKYGLPKWTVDRMMGHVPDDILGKNYDKPDKQMFIEALDKVYFGE